MKKKRQENEKKPETSLDRAKKARYNARLINAGIAQW